MQRGRAGSPTESRKHEFDMRIEEWDEGERA